jgi:protein N-lysine methyltransferase METTL21D
MYDEDERESSDDEESDTLQFADGQGKGKGKKKEYCHYNASSDDLFEIILFDQNFKMLQKPNAAKELGIGAVVWDSSVIFSKYVEFSRNDAFSLTKMAGKTVLELGSGCGLAGLAMMLRGCKVTFTDLPEVMKQLTIPNITRTYRQLASSYQPTAIHPPDFLYLDWTAFEKDSAVTVDEDGVGIARHARLDIMHAPYDLILLTDCVFSMEVSLDLIRTIGLCSGPKTTILCCYETRDEVY